MIKIHTERVVNKDGIACRKIKTIEGGLHRDDDLPREYTQEEPFVRLGDTEGSIYQRGDFCGELPEEEFQKMLEHIRKSAQRLHEIKERTRKLREEWKGEETIII